MQQNLKNPESLLFPDVSKQVVVVQDQSTYFRIVIGVFMIDVVMSIQSVGGFAFSIANENYKGRQVSEKAFVDLGVDSSQADCKAQ